MWWKSLLMNINLKNMKVENNQGNFKKCTCGECPSYDECMKGGKEMLYCARDKSTCAFAQKGCICMQCPVSTENSLKGGYYCSKGVV